MSFCSHCSLEYLDYISLFLRCSNQKVIFKAISISDNYSVEFNSDDFLFDIFDVLAKFFGITITSDGGSRKSICVL